jgi:Tfp pilus assembly protein PilF
MLKAITARNVVLTFTALGVLLQAPANAASVNAAAKTQEAASALLRGNVEQAIKAYSEALRDEDLPNDRRAAILNDRGVANSRLGNHRAAVEDFNRAVQLFPEYAPVYNNRGNTLLALGFTEEALRDFERAIALAPGFAAAYNNRASALLKLGRTAEAIEDYTRAIRLAPQSPASLIGRGQAYLLQNRPFSALREFGRAIVVDSRSSAALRAKAAAAMHVGRFDEAIEDLGRAISFEPENVELHIERAHAYRFADNPNAALRDFTRAVELDPRNARALAGRGLALTKLASFEEAEADLASAIEIDARSAEAFAYRAWLYKQLEQPELGLQEVEKALAINPDLADVHWAKGEVEHALGRTDAAIASLRKALAIMPSHRDASTALQELGVDVNTERDIPAAAIDGWRVVLEEDQRYTAYLEGRAKVRVPLEVVGKGPPRLLEWDVKDGVLRGIGLLRYHAGTVETSSGSEPVELIAIVDTTAGKMVSLQLHRQGDRQSVWTWNEGTVTIESIDGVTDVIVLRDNKPPAAVAQRRPEPSDRGFFGGPFWAPWNQQPSYRRPSLQQQRRPPKTIFDFLFGN